MLHLTFRGSWLQARGKGKFTFPSCRHFSYILSVTYPIKVHKKHKNNSANAVLNRRVSYLNPSAARDAKSKTPDAGFNATPNKPKHKWNLMIFSITSNTAL